MAINENGVQVERQYIGARYVPKFFQGVNGSPEWVAGLAYEALTIVTYLGNSFTSKVPVPAGIGNPADNPTYWVNTGNYNAQVEQINNKITQIENSLINPENVLIAFNNVEELRTSNELKNNMIAFVSGHFNKNDNGQAFYTISYNELNETDNDGNIIVAGNFVAKMIPSNALELVSFGCNSVKDCSVNVNNAIKFAEQNSIKHITCSTGISFSDCVISKDMCFDFMGNTIQCIRSSASSNRVKTLFSSNSPINFELKNAVIKGYNNVSDSGTKPVANSPLMFNNAKSVILYNCEFTTFNNSYIDIPAVFAQRKGCLYTLIDCDWLHINKCRFSNIRGEEIGFHLAANKNRENINGEISYSHFGPNINTSIMDFLGNNLHIHHNVYDYNYAGSIHNAFALNLIVNDELIKGTVANAYDNCEEIYFQGVYAEISRINVTGTVTTLASISASTIYIHDIKSDNINAICNVRKGVGGSTVFDPHVGTTLLPTITCKMANCIFNGAQLIFCSGNPSPNVVVTLDTVVNGPKTRSVIAADQTVHLINCYLANEVDPGFGTIPIWCYFQQAPKLITLTNVTLKNKVAGNEEYVLSNVNNAIMTGCLSDGNNNKTSNVTTLKTANNIGILEN